MSRESMEFDVVIVGGGPAGLSAAIRLGQLSEGKANICVLEKGAEIGAHIISGAVLDPISLNELFPDWKEKNPPTHTPVTEDQFLFLTEKKSFQLPTPPQMRNHGNYIISLSEWCRWLATQAESYNINLFPSFAATDAIIKNDKVYGIITGDKGVDKFGKHTAQYQPGYELLAKQTFLAEGCRGSLSRKLIKHFKLRHNVDPQTYGLGIKEVWEIPENLHREGLVQHTIGWPLNHKTYGGSFVYHFGKNLLSIGFVVGLDYQNTYLNPYKEFQRFKTHPSIAPLLAKSKRLAYGARCINEGGYQSIPKLTFPGGLLIGCAAGFLNVPRIKGIHNAMKTGMIAAESVYPYLLQTENINDTLQTENRNDLLQTENRNVSPAQAAFDQSESTNPITPMPVECINYSEKVKDSRVWDELYRQRNIRPAMNWGLIPGIIYAALDTYILRGHAPWTFHNHADHLQLKPAAQSTKIEYPKPDNSVSYDLMSSVYLTNSIHDENQPCHLIIKNPEIPVDVNLKIYAGPEHRYCPAGVYEFIEGEDDKPKLQINYPNCIHCKACDIKDPTQNIVWTPPEGGSGPQYTIL